MTPTSHRTPGGTTAFQDNLRNPDLKLSLGCPAPTSDDSTVLEKPGSQAVHKHFVLANPFRTCFPTRQRLGQIQLHFNFASWCRHEFIVIAPPVALSTPSSPVSFPRVTISWLERRTLCAASPAKIPCLSLVENLCPHTSVPIA